jgi:hypothetical protein
MTFIAHAAPPFFVGPVEWGFVALTSSIIFVFVGPKIWKQFKSAD